MDTATFIPAYAFQIPAGGLKMPDVESDRLFIRPASTEYEPGTIEEDTTSGKGLSVKSVSVWGTTHKVMLPPSFPHWPWLTFLASA